MRIKDKDVRMKAIKLQQRTEKQVGPIKENEDMLPKESTFIPFDIITIPVLTPPFLCIFYLIEILIY